MEKKKSKKIYYSMGEVSEMFDVNPSLIRFWEQKFDILKPHKNKKGNRMFTPADLENLKLIYHLVKEKGMTLAGAQKRIKENKHGLERDMEVLDRLLSIKSILMEIREELKTGEDDIVVEDDIVDVADVQEDVKEGVKLVETFVSEEVEVVAKTEFDIVGETSPWDDEEMYGGGEEVAEATASRMETVISESVGVILETGSPEPEYIAELSGELSEDVRTAAEVMETLAELEGKKEEPKRPEIYEQTLF